MTKEELIQLLDSIFYAIKNGNSIIQQIVTEVYIHGNGGAREKNFIKIKEKIKQYKNGKRIKEMITRKKLLQSIKMACIQYTRKKDEAILEKGDKDERDHQG